MNWRPIFKLAVLVLCLAGKHQHCFARNGPMGMLLPGEPSAADTAQVSLLIRQGADMGWPHPDSAMLLLHKAEDISLRIGYPDGEAFALMEEAHCALSKGNYKEAARLYKESYPYCRQAIYFHDLTGRLYGDIGVTYQQQANYGAAIHYYLLSIQEMKQHGYGERSSILMTYCNVADAEMTLGEYKQAGYYLKQAEDIARQKQFYGHLSFILTNKGELYAATGQPDKAMASFKESLQLLANDHKQPEWRRQQIKQGDITDMCRILLEQHQPEAAVVYLKQIIQPESSANPYSSYIFPSYLLANAYLQLHQYHLAETTLLPAMRMAKERRFTDEIAAAHKTLAGIYKATGRYEEALNETLAYAQVNDSILDAKKLSAINQLEVKYRTAQQEQKLTENNLLINQQTSQLAKKNAWIWIVSLSAVVLSLLLLLLLVLYRANRQQQKLQAKRLQLAQQEEEKSRHERDLILQREKIQIMQAVIDGEEKERLRLAQELHDGVGGMLAALQMHFSVLHQPQDEALRSQRINYITGLLTDTAAAVRKTAHNLMPDMLQKYSLPEALELYCSNSSHLNGQLQVALQVHAVPDDLSKKAELSIYRIVQEIMSNTLKHAEATQLSIQLIAQGGRLRLITEDNGKGFVPDAATQGIGLQNIQARVQALQGVVSIDAALGQGTVLCAEFDIKNLKEPNDPKHTYSHS